MAGFADLRSLYFSLALQLEGWFHALPEIMGTGWGWEEFEKESWAFKHDRLTIERRLEAGGAVKTSDISHLLELFQSALLKYWEVSGGDRAGTFLFLFPLSAAINVQLQVSRAGLKPLHHSRRSSSQ